MKIYALEFETCEEWDGYHDQNEMTYILGTYSSKELALNAAKELLVKSVNTLRNNLLSEADYIKTIYNENLARIKEPEFIDDVVKAINNAIDELGTEGSIYLSHWLLSLFGSGSGVERYFDSEIMCLNLNEFGFDEPAKDIIESIDD